MRALVVAALFALAGCTSIAEGPAVVVKNDLDRDITGHVALLVNATGALETDWGFTVPALAYREIAHLPTDAPGDHRLAVRVDGGPTGAGTVRDHVGDPAITVRVDTQGVRVEQG